MLPLQREADKGLLDLAGQTLGQIQTGAWASIRDYWLHMRGSVPPAYAHVDALLRQEGAALAANNQDQAAAIAEDLTAAWAPISPRRAGMAWLPIGGGVLAVLLVLVSANELRGWHALARRREHLRDPHTV